MPSCEFCGCKVSQESFRTVSTPAFGVYVCGKAECDLQLADFIQDIREFESSELQSTPSKEAYEQRD